MRYFSIKAILLTLNIALCLEAGLISSQITSKQCTIESLVNEGATRLDNMLACPRCRGKPRPGPLRQPVPETPPTSDVVISYTAGYLHHVV